ncbi:MAG: F0F1 ATP synthase subunit A [Coriobacteriia bacterium]|nr:F0F1 ATP synthase subunit A [Coriobacteriia bacterium]
MKPLDGWGLVVIVNSLVVAGILVGAGAWLARGELSPTSPGARQNLGESVLSFFVGKARGMAHGDNRDRIMGIVAPLLATFFLFIMVSNLLAMIPIPIVNRPPTSHFSVTLGLALCAVLSTLVVSAAVKGTGKTLKHLVWPNPLQWVSEITDVMSLSLRLFGNIAGEYMTVALVVLVVPWGIPLILHALGLIPAFVQALVFTLLTTSFLANALHDSSAEKKHAPDARPEGRS